jgi:hypothetical protein
MLALGIDMQTEAQLRGVSGSFLLCGYENLATDTVLRRVVILVP